MALTLLDIAKINAQNPRTIPLIEENILAAPEFGKLPGRIVSGTTATLAVRTDYPRGGFRRPNDSVAAGQSSYESKLTQLAYYDNPLVQDEAVLMACDRGPSHILQLEESGAMRGFLLTFGQQVWYGQNAANGLSTYKQGFMGARDLVDSGMVKDAGGTTANTGSTVWFVVAREGFVEMITGANSVVTLNAWVRQAFQATNIANVTGTSFSWVNNIGGWTGVAFENRFGLGCIKNITADSGHTLTDTLISQAIAKFPVGIRPTHCFMNRTCYAQLQAARTVTIFGTGDVQPSGRQQTIVPMVTTVDGDIEVVRTDSLSSTEALW